MMGFGNQKKSRGSYDYVSDSINDMEELHKFFSEEITFAYDFEKSLKEEIKNIREFEDELKKFQKQVEYTEKIEKKLVSKIEDIYVDINVNNQKIDIDKFDNDLKIAETLYNEIANNIKLILDKISFFKVNKIHELYSENEENKSLMNKISKEASSMDIKIRMIGDKINNFYTTINNWKGHSEKIKQKRKYQENMSDEDSQNSNKLGF